MRCDRCAIHSSGDRPLANTRVGVMWSNPARGLPAASTATLDLCASCLLILNDWWMMACEVLKGVDASRLSKAMLSEMNINSPLTDEVDTDE